MEFKYRNTATSLANSISLVFPDVIEDLWDGFFFGLWVCTFFVFHVAKSDPSMLLHYVSVRAEIETHCGLQYAKNESMRHLIERSKSELTQQDTFSDWSIFGFTANIS